MKKCMIEECGRPVKARGLCSTHHQRLLRNGNPYTIRKKTKKEPKQCQWIRCGRSAVSKGYCPKHYYIQKKLKQFESVPAASDAYETATL